VSFFSVWQFENLKMLLPTTTKKTNAVEPWGKMLRQRKIHWQEMVQNAGHVEPEGFLLDNVS